MSFGKRMLSLAVLCLISNNSPTNVFNTVQASVNSDKVSFQVFELDSPLVDINWCGTTNEVILVQSTKGIIYRSRDRGDSWKKLHSIMNQTGQSVIDDETTEIGKVKKMMQNPVDESLIVFTGTHGVNWVTEDCGANLKALNSGKKIHELKFHPSQRSWALAAGWTSCEDFDDGEPCEIYKELYMTKDLGNSWQFLKSHVFDFSWGSTEVSVKLPNKNLPDSRIFITHDPNAKGNQRSSQRWKQKVHLYYSDDFFKSQKIALDAGNSIVLTNHFMFVAKAISESTIKISVARAETGFLDFVLVRMPQEYHITTHYTVMDTAQKIVFLYVADNSNEHAMGNLFVSDQFGYRFTHSLENIIKGQNQQVDFEAVESMDGSFIANRYDREHVSGGNAKNAGNLRPITDDEILEGQEESDEKKSGTMNKSGKRSKKVKPQGFDDQFNDKIRTYITHNRGSSWELIRAPEQDMKGKSTNCFSEDGCSLNLNMYSLNTNAFAPPYSQESAIGVVMAIGNVGNSLDIGDNAKSKKGTYLSRDGGLTWAETAKIPLIYEFGDHGGLLVAAPNVQSTTQVRYSWNEGKTWTKLKITDQPIYIKNIIIEPKSTAQQFVVYGSYDTSGAEDTNSEDISKGAVMITLDFSGLQTERCKGVDNAGKDGSDYELWSPHDDGRHGSNKECFLGHQVTYIRRKQMSECFNGEDMERQTMRVPCACTTADYQCDMDYYMTKAGKCEKLKDSKAKGESIEEKDCSLTGFYFESKGYRKIPGNYCQGGLQMDPVKRYCSKYGQATNLIQPKQLAMAAILIAAMYYGWPLIEAIILILPIPDPKGSVDALKNVGNTGIDIVSGVLTSSSSARTQSQSHQGYGQNLEAAPDAFMEDDDSGDDIGKIGGDSGLNYDSDDKNDEESVAVGQQSELIDLGGSSSTSDGSRRAANIPKLSGPR